MLKRHIAFYGQAPRQTAADAGFGSRDNLAQAKFLGVQDAAFHKKSGLRIIDMVKSNWVYRKLRNFQAGIEADISCLKRAYGLARCLWPTTSRPTSGPRPSPAIRLFSEVRRAARETPNRSPCRRH
jgi:IS5 family transposase